MSIVQKDKICKSCGELKKIFSRGRCKFCATKEDSKPLRKASPKAAEKRKEERKDFPKFFQDAIEKLKLNPVCQETGAYIYNPSSVHCAHIFPKRKYKSIACNIDNIIFLTWDKHTELDSYLDCMDMDRVRERFPKVFNIMRDRFLTLEPLIEEQGKLLEEFKKCFK